MENRPHSREKRVVNQHVKVTTNQSKGFLQSILNFLSRLLGGK